MRRILAAGVAALSVLPVLSCAPWSISSGKLGSTIAPWTFRTQYAYWDEYVPVEVTTSTGRRTEYKRREDTAGGTVLRIRLHGFLFNPHEDRREWSIFEKNHYSDGLRTQPSILLSVTHAQALSSGDKVVYDSESPTTTGNDPEVSITYYPGEAELSNRSEYPDHVREYGSRYRVELEFGQLGENPGPAGWVRGGLVYTVDKDDGDPDDVVTGEIKVNFSAEVIGERLAKCNESGGGFGSDDCEILDPETD
ncbi:MAG: hypothetical protein HY904_02720 [Deltaproteobacteria bacterium]|nr:hypothetical protein [Deltaproteobacteria bacterium]